MSGFSGTAHGFPEIRNKFVFSCTETVKYLLLEEGTDPKYGARHLKRAIEKNVVFPLANLVATAQVKLGDFVRIDLGPERRMTFMKEAEGTMGPSLLERYEREARLTAMAARVMRSAASLASSAPDPQT